MSGPSRGDTRAAREILGYRNDLIAVADNEPTLAASGGNIVAESVVATRRCGVLNGRVAVGQYRDARLREASLRPVKK